MSPTNTAPLTDGELTLLLHEFAEGDLTQRRVPQYSFRMRLQGISEDAGRIDLRTSLTPALEIYGGNVGYEVFPAFRGRRLASRSLSLVAAFARQLGISSLLITCAETNWASRRTCELAGARLVGIRVVDIPEIGARSSCFYQLLADQTEGAELGSRE